MAKCVTLNLYRLAEWKMTSSLQTLSGGIIRDWVGGVVTDLGFSTGYK